MRPSGSSHALPETLCLHQERNTTCVSPCLSNPSSVSPGSGLRTLGTGCFLFVLHGRIRRRWRLLPLLFNPKVSSNLFNLFNGLFSPQRLHALHPTSVSSREIHPKRSILTFQIDASNRFQWCLVATPCSLWRKHHRHASVVHGGYRCNRATNVSDLMRYSHDGVLGHVRDEFLTMMLEAFSAGFLELNLAFRTSCSFA